MNTLCDLTAINNQGSLYEFELIYITLSYKFNIRFILKLYIKKEDLILSLSNLYINANWLEREIWDLFGIKFLYHKDLRRILTDYGFSGHPLLKIFPLMGFTELRYDDSLNKIIKEMIELSQSLRLFNYVNPWVHWYN
jgi:NADH:ubiquinone oxidoreductase subunit C